MELIDTLVKWTCDGMLIKVGVIMLVGIFIASFSLKTFWGQWDDRARQDEIYGKPGANIKKKKQLHEQER